jgi:hypothetical protein
LNPDSGHLTHELVELAQIFVQGEFGECETLQKLSNLRQLLSQRERAAGFEKVMKAGLVEKLAGCLSFGTYDLQLESIIAFQNLTLVSGMFPDFFSRYAT